MQIFQQKPAPLLRPDDVGSPKITERMPSAPCDQAAHVPESGRRISNDVFSCVIPGPNGESGRAKRGDASQTGAEKTNAYQTGMGETAARTKATGEGPD